MTSPLWHPMTQHKVFPEMIAIDRAEGAYLYTKDGGKILDGISSWWVNTHGHCHPKIVQAIQDQAAKLEQVIFAGFTHDPAEQFAQKLLQHTAPNLEHIFLSDSGSTAIEVALKMAIGYWLDKGETRTKFVALEGGYHGDTFGAMSAGARSIFTTGYEPYLFEAEYLPFPDPVTPALDKFEDLLKIGDVSALILEPLIQGAGGMRIYSPETLDALFRLAREYDALIIADEVMTGFGRTGTMFACDQVQHKPDLVALSKGITGGFLPMGATLATKEIYNAFFHLDRSKQFFHSTSFTGNPLACAAALASLDVWETEPVQERIANIAAQHEKAVQHFSEHDMIANARSLGAIFAVDIALPSETIVSDLATQLYNFYLENDVLLRPIGNTVYALPPYCVTDSDLEKIYDVIERSLDHIRDERSQRAA